MLPATMGFVLTRTPHRFYRADKLRSREIPDKRALCLPRNGKKWETSRPSSALSNRDYC
jgi:hypothetical protein